MSIEEEIHNYIVETFNIEADEDFTQDVNLFDYGYVDSLDAMTILAYLESNFGINISQRDLMLYPMNSINDLVAVVKIKKEG